MKVRPLVINGESQAVVMRVLRYAERNRYDLRDVFAIMGGRRRPPGDNDDHTCVIPVGYRCVFSIEQQPIGWCRHLSVAVLGDGQCPNEVAVREISRMFCFRVPWPRSETVIQLEDLHPGYGVGENKKAVNIVQLLDPPATPKADQAVS